MKEQKGKRKASRRKKKRIAFLAFFVILTVALGTGFSLSFFFKVKNIETSGSTTYSHDEIVNSAGITEKSNLFSLSEEKILLNIQEKLPLIESLKISRKLPNTLHLKLKEVDTYYCFLKSGSKYITDSFLRIINSSVPDALNAVYLKCNFTVDDESKKIIIEQENSELIKNAVRLCKENDIKVNLIEITNEKNIRMTVDSRFEVEFGTAHNFNEKYMQMIAMIKRIDKDKKGKINLSDWTKENTKGYFTESEIADIELNQ